MSEQTSMSERDVARWIKIALLASVQLYFLLVVLNNVVDFNTNYDFVRHVLSMDTTAPGNHAMGRAIHSAGIWMAFYIGIILWELASALLCAWGVMDLWSARRGTAAEFARAKRVGMIALTVGMLQWMLAFLTIGGEFFLMWTSPAWNGQQAAFRMFVVEGIVLLLLMTGEGTASSAA